jgi:hypothetical protein
MRRIVVVYGIASHDPVTIPDDRARRNPSFLNGRESLQIVS